MALHDEPGGHGESEAERAPDWSSTGGVDPDILTAEPMRFLELWCTHRCVELLAPGGVTIEIVDGPAWSVAIDVSCSHLEGLVVDACEHDDGAGRWWQWWSDGVTFRVVAALGELQSGLEEFRRFALLTDRPPDGCGGE